MKKKLYAALKELAKEFESELPSKYLEDAFKDEQQVYEALEERCFIWRQDKWEKSTPTWIQDAIQRFEADLLAQTQRSPWTIVTPRIPIFHDYLNTLEKFIGIETSTRHDEFEKISKESKPDKWNNLPVEWQLAAYELNNTEVFAFVFRSSFFVNLYGYAETFLAELHSGSMPRNSIIKSLAKELAGPLLSKIPEWESIQRYSDIRNCLVHEEGFLDDSKQQRRNTRIRAYINKTPSLKLSQEIDRYGDSQKFEKIILTKEFCQDALVKIETFLMAISFVASQRKDHIN